MAATLFVIWGGGDDASLFRSAKGHQYTSAGVTVPSKVVCLSVDEVGTCGGEGDGRGPDILSAGVRSTNKEGRDNSCEDDGELHGGGRVLVSEVIIRVTLGSIYTGK